MTVRREDVAADDGHNDADGHNHPDPHGHDHADNRDAAHDEFRTTMTPIIRMVMLM